jgi:hypothetical protein
VCCRPQTGSDGDGDHLDLSADLLGLRAEVARDEHTTRYQVEVAFLVAGDELLARREKLPRRLSLDEAHHRRGRKLATVVSNLDRGA